MNLNNIVLNNVQRILNRHVTHNEAHIIKQQLAEFNPTSFNPEELDHAIKILIDIIVKKITLLPKDHNYNTIVEEELLQKEEIKLPNIAIGSILGTTDPLQIRLLLNPSSLVKKAYAILDRRYHMRISQDNSSFSWNLTTEKASHDNKTSVVLASKLKNIVGLQVTPFRFPATQQLLTFPHRISLLIEELKAQAYMSPNNKRRFHFLFKPDATSTDPTDPYEISDVGNYSTQISLHNTHQTLNQITISFGNPLRTLILDPDQLHATVSSSGIQTLFTFTESHLLKDGDTVFIEDFTTDDPDTDYAEIALINDEDGWPITNSTLYTFAINLDISGLSGTILNNPMLIYFESKRFMIPLTFMYRVA